MNSNLNPISPKKYVKHIDGIRALAILPVLFYHINPTLCPLGYAGVDVFFVISGFLITLGLLNNLYSDKFSILDFYDRRIRRIIPIYTAIIIAVLLLAPLAYYPELLVKLKDMTISSTFFLSNVYLFFTQDYFAIGSSISPLTNLWSLSVEEQFYVFLPIFLMIIFKITRKYIIHSLVILFILSISSLIFLNLYQEYMNSTGYGNHLTVWFNNAKFYMLPFRMWELLTGSILAYITYHHKKTISKPKDKYIAFAALFIIAICYFKFIPQSVFFNIWAMPFIIGTTLLIRYGNAGITGRILESSPLVFIGKISYSLYLIHFPLFEFYRQLKYNHLTAFEQTMLVVLAIVISIITWRFIEIPIRISKTWTRKKSFILFFISSLSIIFLSIILMLTEGLTKYINITPFADVKIDKPLPLLRETKELIDVSGTNYSKLRLHNLGQENSKEKILLLGDSHAGAIAYNLDIFLKEKGISGVYPRNRIEGSWPEEIANKEDTNHILYDILNYVDACEEKVTAVLFVNRWRNYKKDGSGTRVKIFEKGLEKICDEFNKRNIKVFFATHIPVHKFHLVEYSRKKDYIKTDFNPILTEEEYFDQFASSRKAFFNIGKKNKAYIIDSEKIFPKENNRYKIFTDNGNLMYGDSHHLSDSGSKFFIEKVFEEYKKSNQ